MTNIVTINHSKRNWQCFVCGKVYLEFDLFKTHILETHDEKSEYVICPIEACGYPVRDVKIHFKAKHPNEPMPSLKNMRATVWKDVTNKKDGLTKTRKPSFRTGTFISRKNGNREFYYRSGWECEVYECLEVLPEFLQYEAEPIKPGIVYFFNGIKHHYIPDLGIKYSDDKIEIWEIKPDSQKNSDINLAKWSAANAFCKERGWTFMVLTETGIQTLKNKVKLLLVENAIRK